MKKYLLFLLALSLGLPIMAQDRADRQYLKDPKSFSMILLGDPQGYTKFDMNQPLFDLCTAWIEDNIDQLNIKAVLCTGDIVEQNDNLDTKQKITNQTGHEMWMAASNAFARLDNKDYVFRHHLETTVEDTKELQGITWKRVTALNNLKGIVKVRVDHIGRIVKVGEY